MGAPSAPASKEQIEAAAHDHELVYYQERDGGSEEIGDNGEGLDKLGEIVQGLESVEDKGEKLVQNCVENLGKRLYLLATIDSF